MRRRMLASRKRQTVGVFRWVLDKTMSRKSAAVGTGAMALRLLVAIVVVFFLVRSREKNNSQFNPPKRRSNT